MLTNKTHPAQLPRLNEFKGQSRAFLKVQDGCDGICSRCIIPKVRSKVHSKGVGEILKKAQRLVAAGHNEIVVTGIFLGAYGERTVRRKKWVNGENGKLAEMLEKLAKIAGLKRVRLSSLELGDVTEKLLDVFCKNRNFMPHLHLSLQSGSDKILKKMCRRYGVDEFMRTVELVKKRLVSIPLPIVKTNFPFLFF